VIIVEDDAFLYAEHTMPGEKFDYAFVDTWRDASDGAPMYLKMKKLERLHPKTEFSYWVEGFILSRIRAYNYSKIAKKLDTGATDAPKSYDEFIEKLAEKFGININEDEKQIACDIVSVPREKNTAYCPNHQCPSHEPYFVGSERFLRPNRIVQDPVGGKFCAICGELLETRCPNCGAAINDGAVCSCCGKKYVAI
jgi:hypothetical protein